MVELQEGAENAASFIRSFVKGKSTRQLNHDTLRDVLRDARDAGLPFAVLVGSGLYAAVRMLAEQGVAGEMFGAIGQARALANEWEEMYGADALEEVV